MAVDTSAGGQPPVQLEEYRKRSVCPGCGEEDNHPTRRMICPHGLRYLVRTCDNCHDEWNTAIPTEDIARRRTEDLEEKKQWLLEHAAEIAKKLKS